MTARRRRGSADMDGSRKCPCRCRREAVLRRPPRDRFNRTSQFVAHAPGGLGSRPAPCGRAGTRRRLSAQRAPPRDAGSTPGSSRFDRRPGMTPASASPSSLRGSAMRIGILAGEVLVERSDARRLRPRGQRRRRHSAWYAATAWTLGVSLQRWRWRQSASGRSPSDVGHCLGVVGLADAFLRTRAIAPPGGRKSRESQCKM